mmetsp:Transcript_121453/g.339008  ORF Transcript_121453/g.339008 Transcript_121453/m.339008 type:complete len:469 (-) Transcript_121453:153-1559(-)
MASTRSAASSSICVQFTSEQCPRTFKRATAVFAAFGELARIDMSFTAAKGVVLVTFFDVRCAELALTTFKGLAKRLPQEAHDFRAVSISSSLFAQLPDTFTGFDAFGDIAGVAISGEDMIIEFYDMRAAQRVTLAIPGSRPHQPPTVAPAQPLSLVQAMAGSEESQAAPAPESPPQASQALTAAPASPGAVTRGTACSTGGTSNAAGHSPAGGGGKAAGGGPGGGGSPASAPAREKMDAKDLAKFDIVPEKIRSGEDTRTTVMVRNIPRGCSREDFVELLARNGTDNYGFFYMPFDKRRDIHCGFAFVDFRSPDDILRLHECLKEYPSWWQAPPNGGSPLAVSYARLQGQEQLLKHFSLSAVMYDNDSRKRPVFFNDGASKDDPEKAHLADASSGEPAMSAEAHLDGTPAKVEIGASTNLQPRYIPVPSCGGLGSSLDAQDMPSGASLTVGLSGFNGVQSCDHTLLGA